MSRIPGLAPTDATTSDATTRDATTHDATTGDANDSDSASSSLGPTWPLQSVQGTNLPAELYKLVCFHLSMEDAKALRLTCREIEQYVSPILFESIVVPFHMSIFQNARPCLPSDTGKERENVVVDVDLFHNHGRNIKRFGIRFEIPEVVLAVPPEKKLLSPSSTFWGRYNWPSSDYPRYDRMKDLEGFADDGSVVREAISTLSRVEELALSVDNSLGWLAGPDKSIRDQLLVEREPIIQQSFFQEPSRKTTAYRKIWDIVDAEFGLLQSTDTRFPVTVQRRRHPIVPNRLSPRQIELLLENWWAQHAFLTSFVVSVIDTLPSSALVQTLNIDRLSADFMDFLCRADFWAALPHLCRVKIFVVGQFRQIHKDDLGSVSCTDVRPSRAVPKFRELLEKYIAPIKNIKKLAFGWASGGENEKGMYGRNMFLLPVPFLSYEPGAIAWGRQVNFDGVISFPFVEELRVQNCWMTADAMTKLVLNKKNQSLRKLTLDSVSAPNRPSLLPFENPTLFWRGPMNNPAGATIGRVPHPDAWSGVLDKVSPGINLRSVGEQSRNAFEDDLALQELELISCGYCALPNRPFRYEDLDSSFKQREHASHLNATQLTFITQRSAAIEPMMMMPHDAGLAEIVQVIPPLDEWVLSNVFEARIGPMGWPSPQQAAFDHRLPGGSGRFSTVLRRRENESNLEDEPMT
ncbi:uncharacterized protein BKA78DRAFT_253044 [Phyllosticta capitalensis]|uniref:uncharacterized protein n=1 Tax=Phyllosticta capitalensis TaxID=121624 RepID=UPI00312CCBA1